MRLGLAGPSLLAIAYREVLVNHIEMLLAPLAGFTRWLELNLRLRVLVKLDH